MRMRRVADKTQTETSWILLAKQKNALERANLQDRLRLIDDEKAHIIDKYHRREEALERRMADIGYTRSMPLLLLNMIHLQRRMTSHDVSMNIANCYLMHQEKNLEKAKAAVESNGDVPPKDLDKQALRHARFIRNAFEEAYNIATDVNWTYGYDRSADIYEYGRAGHDLHCTSVKGTPIGVKTGAYPQFKEVNVAAYDGRKVEGIPRQVSENVQSLVHQSASLLPQIQGGKQHPQTPDTKAGLRARPPSAVRPRLTLYMKKRQVRIK